MTIIPGHPLTRRGITPVTQIFTHAGRYFQISSNHLSDTTKRKALGMGIKITPSKVANAFIPLKFLRACRFTLSNKVDRELK